MCFVIFDRVLLLLHACKLCEHVYGRAQTNLATFEHSFERMNIRMWIEQFECWERIANMGKGAQ